VFVPGGLLLSRGSLRAEVEEGDLAVDALVAVLPELLEAIFNVGPADSPMAIEVWQDARASVLLRQIAARKARIARDFWLIGDALREILRDKLFVALGHQSFEELLSKRTVVSLATAKRLITIAEQVPREQALKLGPNKAYELVRYTEWTDEEDTVAELVKTDALVDGKPVSQASATHVSAASQRLRQKKKPQSATAKELAARMEKGQAALQAFLIAHGVAEPDVERSGRGWNVRISVEQVEGLREPG
jgi:hypothetical protein